MKLTHLLLFSAATFLLSSLPAFSYDIIRECPQANGSTLYTNKDIKGCSLMTMKRELSIVPSLDKMPTIPQQPTPVTATEAPKAVSDVCLLFREYTELAQTTHGGVQYDRIEDNQRFIVLLRLFGSGYVPVSCQ